MCNDKYTGLHWYKRSIYFSIFNDISSKKVKDFWDIHLRGSCIKNEALILWGKIDQFLTKFDLFLVDLLIKNRREIFKKLGGILITAKITKLVN